MLAAIGEPVLGQNTSFNTKIDQLFDAFKNADYEAMRAMLDEKVKIGDLPTGMNDAVVPQLLAQLPKPESYKIISLEKEGNDTRVKTVFSVNGQPENKSFLFNAAGKVIEMDILGNVHAEAVEMPVDNGKKTTPGVIDIPFKEKHGLIFVKAEVNGESGNFLLDTGAPLLMVNSRHFTNDSATKVDVDAQGIGGKINDMKMMHVDSFNVQGLQLRDADLLATDLHHIEKKVRTKFLGLIGYDLLKDYVVTLDYDDNNVSLVRADTQATSDEYGSEPPVYLATAPIEMVGHIPVITVTINGKPYKMGIDCGAEGNIMYEKYIPKLGANFKAKRKLKLGGAGKDVAKVPSGIIKEAKVGKVKFEDMRTVFSDENLKTINDAYGSKLDGLVGYPFLRQYITAIDYAHMEVRFYTPR